MASFLCFGGICTARISSEDSTDGGRRLPRLPGEVLGWEGGRQRSGGFLHIAPSPPLCLAGPGADRRCGGRILGRTRTIRGQPRAGSRALRAPCPRHRIAGIFVIFAVGERWHPSFVPARRSPGGLRGPLRPGPGHAWAARGAGAGEEEEEEQRQQQPRVLGGRGRKAGAEAELLRGPEGEELAGAAPVVSAGGKCWEPGLAVPPPSPPSSPPPPLYNAA